MSITFDTNIDFRKNQILNARLQNLSAAPSTPGAGQQYWNTTDVKAYIWSGSAWVDMTATGGGGGGTVTTLSIATANGFSGSVATPTTTPVITLTLQNATTGQSGQLTSTDWNTFNNKAGTASPTFTGTANFAALSTSGNVIIGGNLTVNGTTTTVNSTTVTIDDPVFTLGGDTAPGSDDNKDRGIEFRWHNGTVAKLGFFGFDDSTGKFTFIPDATNTSEVFSGAVGRLDAVAEKVGNTHNATGYGHWAGTQAAYNALGTYDSTTVYEITDAPASGALKYAANIVGTATSEVITHGLGTKDVHVQLYRVAAPYDIIYCDVELTSTTTLTLRFGTAPTSAEYRIVVLG